MYDLALETRKDEAAAMKECNRMGGISWVGAKRGGVFAGSLPVTSGAFVYQIEGHKLFCCVPIMECLGLMQRQDGFEVPDDVTSDMAPTLMKARISFVFCCDCYFDPTSLTIHHYCIFDT